MHPYFNQNLYYRKEVKTPPRKSLYLHIKKIKSKIIPLKNITKRTITKNKLY